MTPIHFTTPGLFADPESPYVRWLGSDNDHCQAVIGYPAMLGILGSVALRVQAELGQGPKPEVSLDLEQIQVADYGSFDGVDERQRELIARLQAEDPIRPEEMVYLALRSLFQFAWPPPENENELRQAAAHDVVLNRYLTNAATSLAPPLAAEQALLPYWGRLAFLRVMAEIPTEQVARFGLDKVAVTLMKRAKFNATTFAFDEAPIVGLNYGLQPVLKQLNRYLLHYFSTQEMAGAGRLDRAWAAIVPTVLHFWSKSVAVTELTRSTTTIYGQEHAVTAHLLTTLQVDFIIMHELGHIALHHPNRLRAEARSGQDITCLRHEFEFAADAFAVGLMRSKVLRRLRPAHEVEDVDHATRELEGIVELHREHQKGIDAASLLFLYMDFVQRAGDLLRERLGDGIGLGARMDSHPRAVERLERLELMNIGDHPYTSQLQRYAKTFLQDVLDYAAALDDASLLASASTRTA